MMMMRQGAFRPAVASPRAAAVRGGMRVSTVRRAQRASRAGAVKVDAIFSFLAPKPAEASAAPPPRARELVEDLVKLCSGTDAGSNVSPQRKANILAAANEISKYCIKNPLKSKLLWGEYEVLFASKPTAVGGPLRTTAGQAVFPGQSAKQILSEPNKLTNVVEFKTLGFVPGYSKQFGEIEPISPDTFLLKISTGELKAGLGPAEKKEFKINRQIQILYLDETLRVVKFLPNSELEDVEGAQSEPIVFVFKRIGVEEDEEEEEEEQPGAKRPSLAPSALFGKKESMATQVERKVLQKLKDDKKGTVAVSVAPAGSRRVAVAPPAPAKPQPVARGATVSSRQGTQRAVAAAAPAKPDPRAAAAAARQKAAEEAAAAKAKEAAAKEAAQAKARAEAAKAKEAEERAEKLRQEKERQASIKALLAQLEKEAKDAQAEGRNAQQELRDIERASGATLKSVAAAKSKVSSVEAEAAALAEQVAASLEARKAFEQQLKDAEAAYKETEKRAKQLVGAGRK